HVWCQIDRDVPEEIVALTLHDRAWSRAFKAAARRFYGERNFDGALDEHTSDDRDDVSPELSEPSPLPPADTDASTHPNVGRRP
ncbi:MAG: hypothetical protein WD010_08210, partial [Nitriliruptor sp.]